MSDIKIDTSRLQQIRDALTAIEHSKPYELSNAASQKSGYTVGLSQFDLGQHPEEAAQVADLLKKAPEFKDTTAETMNAIAAGLAKPGKDAAVYAMRDRIGKVLDGRDGRKLIDRFDEDQVQKVAAGVQRVIDAAKPEHRLYLESPQGIAVTASIINQTGNAGDFEKLVRGETVTHRTAENGPTNSHKVRGPLDLDQVKDYVRGFQSSQERDGSDFDRRMKIIETFPGPEKRSDAASSGPQADVPSPEVGAPNADHEKIKEQIMNSMVTATDPVDEILLKDPAAWTKDEMSMVMQAPDYWRSYGRGPEIQTKTRDWFVKAYNDAASGGRGPAPSEPSQAQDASGGTLIDGLRSVGSELADRARNVGWPEAITTLQRGINRMPTNTMPIEEDGDFGPETSSALRRAVAQYGSGPLLELFGP